MKRRGSLAPLLGILGHLAAGFAGAADTCSLLEGKDAPAHSEYLRGDRAKLSDACIVKAIEYISAKRYAPASQVLIAYLDYHEPNYQLQIPVKRGILEIYPAVDALISLGKPVVPELIATLSKTDVPELVRQNVAAVISFIYIVNPPEGVTTLVRSARSQPDPTAAIRLMDEARKLAGKCNTNWSNACENAALREEK